LIVISNFLAVDCDLFEMNRSFLYSPIFISKWKFAGLKGFADSYGQGRKKSRCRVSQTVGISVVELPLKQWRFL